MESSQGIQGLQGLQAIPQTIERNLKSVLQNPYIMAFLKVTLVLYAVRLAPRLPSAVQDTFENTFVKILAIMLLAYISEVDFQLAILLAIVLVLGANLLSGRGVFESYTNVGNNSVAEYQSDMSKYTTLLGKPVEVGKFKLQESLSDNYPGCNQITMKDLLSVFDGDALKLQKTVQYAFADLNRMLPPDASAKAKLTSIARAVGLPYNVEMNDANAPLLATLLLNYGYKISESCQVPQ